MKVFVRRKRAFCWPPSPLDPNPPALTTRARVQAKFGQLIKGKQPPEQIFDQLSPGDVNEQMHTFMPKLTAKVFRTYNASIVLDDELAKMPAGLDLEQRKLFYTEANTRVAILCNHQRCAACWCGVLGLP